MPPASSGEVELPGAAPDSDDAARAARHWIPGSFTLLAWIFLFQVVLGLVPLLTPLTGETWSNQMLKTSLGCLLFAVLLPIYLKRDGLTVRDLGFGARPLKRDLAQGCAAGLTICACNLALFYYVFKGPSINLVLGMFSSEGAHAFSRLFSIVVLAPVVEELFFRGCIIIPLRKCWGLGPRRDAVYALVSGVLFACGHLLGSPLYYIVYVLTGVAFAVLYQRTGSLRTSMIAHAVMNASAMTLGAILR